MCDEKTKALEARVVELTTTNKTNADEIARLTDENATLTKELDGYRATERTELAAKLTELTGEEPDADTPIAALRANVELAARVASKLKPAAKELERGQRKTRAAPAKLEDEDPRSEAARLFALGRAQLRR